MAFTDIFKIQQFKDEISKLLEEKKDLTKNYDQRISQLNQQLDVKLTATQQSDVDLEASIDDHKVQLEKLKDSITALRNDIKNKEKYLEDEKATIEDLKAEIGDLEADKEFSSFGLHEPNYSFATALGYKEALDLIRDEQKKAVRDKTAVSYNPNWRVNDSKAKGRQMNRNNIKAILRSFNNECSEAINKVTFSNYDRIQKRISKSFEQHNSMYAVVEIQMNDFYLELKQKELDLAYSYQQKKAEEKDKLREQREKEREDKAVERELKEQRKQLSKETEHYTKAIEELTTKMQDTNDDNHDLQVEIEKLRGKLDELHSKQSEIDYREKNATAGYVYVISNVGSFGKDVVKIGVTRRLEPLDRIAELSSASVPFKFDVHALIFSEDAYALEAQLHKRFDRERINKVNNRKEYFRISIAEIKKVLQSFKQVTVDFHENPEASEYRESLAIMGQDRSKTKE